MIAELKDEATRARIQPLMPFLKLRNPRPDSSKFISDFARKTGDLSVLSRVDLQLLALTYELEKERNKGDWRLRNNPSQKTLNGKPPGREEEGDKANEGDASNPSGEPASEEHIADTPALQTAETPEGSTSNDIVQLPAVEEGEAGGTELEEETAEATSQVQDLSLDSESAQITQEDLNIALQLEEEQEIANSDEIKDDGDGEWITPDNLDKHRKKDKSLGTPQPIEKMLQVAILTTDNAMRNVALRINLKYISALFYPVPDPANSLAASSIPASPASRTSRPGCFAAIRA